MLVNGHGGNLQPLRQAVATLRAEGRNVLAWTPTGPANDSHAGHTETSAMLRIRPTDVALTHAQPGNTEPLPDLIDQLREHGIAAVSPSGVLGDPTTASPADGEQILDRWTDALTAHVTAWLHK